MPSKVFDISDSHTSNTVRQASSAGGHEFFLRCVQEAVP